MNRIEEDTEVKYKDLSELSYKDTGIPDVELFVNGKSVGIIEVWTDRGNENREYIILSYEMIHLDTITKL